MPTTALPRLRRLAAIGAVALLSTAACSSSKPASSSGNGVSTNTAASTKDMQSVLDAGYAGRDLGTSPGIVPAVKGKNVWYISCAESQVGCAEAGQGFRAASKALGWNVTYVDGKLDPTVVGGAIQQAIAAKADAVAMYVFDCSTIKNALLQAKQAKVPVVSSWSTDCDTPLFSAVTTFANIPGPDGQMGYSEDKTAWGIVRTNGRAKVIDVAEDDLKSTVAIEKGYRNAIAKCSTCQTVDTVKLSLTTISNAQALVAASLTKHPDANAITIPYDGVVAPVLAALSQAGRKSSMAVIGAACNGGELAAMKQGWNIMCAGYDQKQIGWMEADYVNRLLSGAKHEDLPKVGVGYQLVDPQHNMPSGESFIIPTHYENAYTAAWAKR